MKKIFFLCNVLIKIENGAAINSLVRKCFENENFEIISTYLDEINKEISVD